MQLYGTDNSRSPISEKYKWRQAAGVSVYLFTIYSCGWTSSGISRAPCIIQGSSFPCCLEWPSDKQKSGHRMYKRDWLPKYKTIQLHVYFYYKTCMLIAIFSGYIYDDPGWNANDGPRPGIEPQTLGPCVNQHPCQLSQKMHKNFLLTRNSPLLVTQPNVMVIFKWKLFINKKVSLSQKTCVK